jgi:hypothetical protein
MRKGTWGSSGPFRGFLFFSDRGVMCMLLLRLKTVIHMERVYGKKGETRRSSESIFLNRKSEFVCIA